MLKSDMRHLINTGIWYEASTPDPVFGEVSITPHALNGIRVSESTSGITYGEEGVTRTANIVLFFFIPTSSVDGVAMEPGWKRGDRVSIESGDYVIKGIRRCYDGRTLHHLEVTLE